MENIVKDGRAYAPARGVTLLELLVVMTIMLMVTAAAIPIMMPAMQNRRMREASRLLTSYISAARSRSIESGRVMGLIFERFNQQPFCMGVEMIEVPPPYSGDDPTTSVIVLESITSGKISMMGAVQVMPADMLNPSPYLISTRTDQSWSNALRFGDMAMLNGDDSQVYVISSQAKLPDPKAGELISTPPTNWYLATFDNHTPAFKPGNTLPGLGGARYQIFRQPIRVATAPMELPEGIVVDLLNSGVGSDVVPTNPMSPFLDWDPAILFSPNGSVRSTTFRGALFKAPTSSTYLLLGRRDLMPDVFLPGGQFDANKDRNLWDPDSSKNLYMQNFWISIGYQTGSITVAENAVNTGSVTAARAFATSGQSTGGR